MLLQSTTSITVRCTVVDGCVTLRTVPIVTEQRTNLDKEYWWKARRKYLSLGGKVHKLFTTTMKYGSAKNLFPIVAMLEAEESPSNEKHDIAIKACARRGLVHNEAYVCERAAEFFDAQNDDGWSEFYVLYGEWGFSLPCTTDRWE